MSTNPFDDSSEDDNVSLYEDCNDNVSLLAEAVASTHLRDSTSDDVKPLVVSEAGRKRVAPLSFEVQTVFANPALDFDANRASSQKDFVSPLESAMIGQVDHLKGLGTQESGGDEKDVNSTHSLESEETDGYFSRLKGLSNYFVSYPFESKRWGGKREIDEDEEKEKPNQHHQREETKPLRSPARTYMQGHDGSGPWSPLVEADDVLNRMDVVEKALKNDSNRRRIKASWRKRKEKDEKNVLKKIDGHSKNGEIDHRHATPWNRLIILEELGTASSWIVLLLPYLAFLFAVFDANHTSFWGVKSAVMSTSQMCNGDKLVVPHLVTFPITPPSRDPCSYQYQLVEGEGFLSNKGWNMGVVNNQYKLKMSHGVAFTSGPMTDVPVLSSFLYANVAFSSLSSASVSLIADGSIHYSTVVLQQKWKADPFADKEWYPVSISKPSRLTMTCDRETDASLVSDVRWNCESRRNADMLFSLPDTAVLAGGAVRVDTILSFYKERDRTSALPLFMPSKNTTKASEETIDESNLSHAADYSIPERFLLEISRSASYQFTRASELRAKLLVFVRIVSLFLSILFIAFWFWSMGINGFFLIGECCPCLSWSPGSTKEEALMLKKKMKKEVLWWECPWILFPERRYLLLLLISLLLVQNPLLLYMYYHPMTYSNTKIHFIADSLMGIGFHGLLFMWLCIFEGLRYHTAETARKRAKYQKEILELRRATRLLSSSGISKYHSCESPSEHLASYFDEFGDLHGSGPSAWTNIRLKHDPCGDGWADYLLPKVCLFVLGAFSVVATSLYRCSSSAVDNDSILDDALSKFTIKPLFLHEHREIFMYVAIFQMAILGTWAVLIICAAHRTARVLKKEPFLSTRPAQLAFRVLMSILVLGISSFLFPLLADTSSSLTDWTTARQSWHSSSFDGDTKESSSNLPIRYQVNDESHSFASLLMTLVLHATQLFPYSGTAASLGPGEIIYVTTATLVAAFIFLPSTSYILDEDNQSSEGTLEGGVFYHAQKENQRRDKRAVLMMSSYTHTWRAFPLPIERQSNISNAKVKIIEGYQFDKDFKKVQGDAGRGTIYKKNYVPLFCVETALWLAECSWQTYYSTSEYKTDDFAPGIMNLESVGLELEADIYDEKSDTRAFVASNITSQVDGERDSIIVVAFRGTASSTNLKTDFNWGQEALPERFITGNDGQPEFQINVSNMNKIDIEMGIACEANLVHRKEKQAQGLIHEADALLRSAPLTRLAFPCVHSGFIKAYSAGIRDEVIAKVVQVMQRQIKKASKRHRYSCEHSSDDSVPFVLPKIYITGHSLGGSLAQLLALDISCNVEINLNVSSNSRRPEHFRGLSESGGFIERTFSADVSSPAILTPGLRQRSASDQKPISRRHSFASQRSNSSTEFVHGILTGVIFAERKESPTKLRPPCAVYTFGQPRVGNHSFSRFYKAHVPHTFRVVSEGDAITSLPLATSFPPALYKHAGLEVILDEGSTGNILVGPTVVETLFRFSKVRTNLSAHLLGKYRDGLESALTQDELQEFYRTHGVSSRSIRSGYNVGDVLPEWVTHITRRNF